jgi:hypothetical protein
LGLELLAEVHELMGGMCPSIICMHLIPNLTQILGQVWVKILGPNPTPMHSLFTCCGQSQQRLIISSNPLNPKQWSWPTKSFFTDYGAGPVPSPTPQYDPPRNTKWATVPLGGTGSSRSCPVPNCNPFLPFTFQVCSQLSRSLKYWHWHLHKCPPATVNEQHLPAHHHPLDAR